MDSYSEADYNSFEAPDGNIVWAGALTLAWKDLLHLAPKGNVKAFTIQGSKDLQKIADNFHHSPFGKHDLAESSYYIKSGYGQQTVDQINKQRAHKFKECTFSPINANLGPQAIISYAYLYKKVMYPFKFTRRTANHPFKFKGKDGKEKEVQSFYAEDYDQFKQVLVYQYKNKDDFVVGLKDASDHDQIYLYKAPQAMGVKEVINHIQKQSQKKKSELQFIQESDNFQVPILNLDYKRTLTELVGAELKEFPGYTIEEILEGVKLKLDENGAVVENEGMMMINECAFLNVDPRVLKFDSPFWVVMKEKKGHPYLCVKINNL